MIKKLHIHGRDVAKVLPLVYDESLSYYEVLSKVLMKVNEIIRFLGDLEDYATKEFVIGLVEDLRDDVDFRLEQLSERVDTKLDKAEFEATIRRIDSTLTLVDARLTAEELKSQELDNRITEVRTELVEYIDYSIKNITVISPKTGSKELLQDVLFEIVDMFRMDALTAEEYDSKQLTCTQYQAYDLTAQMYDYYGKNYII